MFEPSLAFLAEDELGVGGYVVGALDSRAFEQRLEAEWWPGLRDRYPAPPSALPPDQWTPEQRAAGFIHAPPRCPMNSPRFTPLTCTSTWCRACSRKDGGRQLINTLIRALREQGSVGLHLFVWPANQRAAGFYRHLGFTVISAEGPVTFAMDLRPAA